MASWTSAGHIPTSANVANNYTGAVNQQAGDYDNIMAAYQSLLQQAQANPIGGPGGGGGYGSSSSSSGPMSFNPITPEQSQYSPTQYSQSAGLGSALSQLNSNAQTGGYSEGDLSNLRARGVSPIRAVYAQAQQNLARQKSLQGGYSPNYGALQSKMAREQSSLISDKMTDVNAGIAQSVRDGKANALSQYGSLTGNENTLMNTINSQNAAGLNNANMANTNAINQANQFNSSMAAQIANMNNQQSNAQFNQQNAGMNNQLNAVQGMQSLYGTTPALVNTFGQQVLQAGNQNIAANQAVNQQNNIRTNQGFGLLNQLPNQWGRGRG